jgi:hypothetical protein
LTWSRFGSVLLLGGVLAAMACSADKSAAPVEETITGNWAVSDSSFRYALQEDADGRVTGFGTFKPSNTVQVDGIHNYPNITLFLKLREGTFVTEQVFDGVYDGVATITGRRNGIRETWKRIPAR